MPIVVIMECVSKANVVAFMVIQMMIVHQLPKPNVIINAQDMGNMSIIRNRCVYAMQIGQERIVLNVSDEDRIP